MEDEYEKKYMSEGGLLYESKSKAPLTFHLLVLAPSLLSALILSIVSTLPGVSPWVLLAGLPALLITIPLWLLFAVLRVTVTQKHLHVQYGLFGPKIPLDQIEACDAVAYDWKRYGGFGIRRARDGSWAYNMMGDQGRAVRVKWRDDKGAEVITLISTPDPEGLAVAVRRARDAARSGPVHARIATDDEVLAEERLLDAELEAEASATADEKDKSAKM